MVEIEEQFFRFFGKIRGCYYQDIVPITDPNVETLIEFYGKYPQICRLVLGPFDVTSGEHRIVINRATHFRENGVHTIVIPNASEKSGAGGRDRGDGQ